MVAAVLLAAGGGSRFDGPTHKLLAPLRGRPLLAHALDAVVASGLDVHLVSGAVEISDLVPEGVTVAHNPQWTQGQAGSLQVGIRSASVAGHDAVVVGLGDQPFVTTGAWQRVAASASPIAVATYDGRRGHPVRLAAEVWPLLPISGDEVGRAVMRDRPDLVAEIPCQGTASDIDTLEDLHRWS